MRTGLSAYGAIHPDAWFCNEIAINCSVNCHKKDGWPRLNSYCFACYSSNFADTVLRRDAFAQGTAGILQLYDGHKQLGVLGPDDNLGKPVAKSSSFNRFIKKTKGWSKYHGK